MDNQKIEALLTEIRDTQREHLAEYRRIAEDAVATQKRAVATVEQNSRLYRLVLAVFVPLMLFLIWKSHLLS